METVTNLTEELESILTVEKELKLRKGEIRAQIRAQKDALRAAQKCSPKYYPAIKGWAIEGGQFDGFRLTGTVLENEMGKKIVKAHIDGRFAHVDLSRFSGKFLDPEGNVQRVYHNGIAC